MSINQVKQTKPETRHPLDEITSSGFIYDALRVLILMALILIGTYLTCVLFACGEHQ